MFSSSVTSDKEEKVYLRKNKRSLKELSLMRKKFD
jgi:hypothetical protein